MVLLIVLKPQLFQVEFFVSVAVVEVIVAKLDVVKVVVGFAVVDIHVIQFSCVEFAVVQIDVVEFDLTDLLGFAAVEFGLVESADEVLTVTVAGFGMIVAEVDTEPVVVVAVEHDYVIDFQVDERELVFVGLAQPEFQLRKVRIRCPGNVEVVGSVVSAKRLDLAGIMRLVI